LEKTRVSLAFLFLFVALKNSGYHGMIATDIEKEKQGPGALSFSEKSRKEL
jgi:hypothetical protein